MGVNLRNLEQIQEQDRQRAGFPLGTLFLSALAGGALMVTVMLLLQREEPTVDERDPLAALIDEQQRKARPAVVEEEHVTFPSLLSDYNRPTTALAAVKDERGRLIEAEPELPSAPSSSQPIDSLPLPKALRPAGDLLHSSSVTQEPKDDLTQLAKERTTDAGELAPPGMQGGYEIQVASFKNHDDADRFAQELRKRGHRAYRQAAYVPEKGLWHRVRVGPFKAKYQAENYQRELEAAERISTFLVDPDKVRRQQAIRDAKAKARERREQRRQRRATN